VPNKLIVLMIDGVSADYFNTSMSRMPHLAALAARGFRVESLHAERCGTSLPGRTSMLTGATAELSGVYGNNIWDGTQWRYATPDDVRVPTIAQRAKASGRDVAVIGFGMIRPEDADIFVPPSFVSEEFVQRARDAVPVPGTHGWIRVAQHVDAHDRFALAMQAAGLPSKRPVMEIETPADALTQMVANDQLAFHWVGALAASDDAPELIISEVIVTDYIQHYKGYKSDQSHWACAYTDMMVGVVLQRLRSAGKEDEYNIAVMSDHGHSPIEKALHPAAIISGAHFQCEGSILHVIPKDAEELAAITEALAPYGVTPYEPTYIPTDLRAQVAAFLAPDGVSFEDDGVADRTQPEGVPVAISSHGIRPGASGDDRFAIFAGPNVPQGSVKEATATHIAPTFAELLGLPLDGFIAAPLFKARTTQNSPALSL
jgi:predicted AlkP superfamily pyrophosphatase or phosphodiesterase